MILTDKIDVGDVVVLRSESFSYFDEDLEELRGVEGEVIHITSRSDGSSKELVLKFEVPKKILITQLPREYVQVAARA
jgi:small-conductance mechanosensitive channel